MRDGNGGELNPMRNIVNLTELWGCPPASVIRKDSTFAKDIIKLFDANYDITDNYIDIPNVYNQAKPTDCNFEIATSNLGQQLRLYRTNDVVGPKVLFYAYDRKQDAKMVEIRKLITDFFKQQLGFSDKSIIMIEKKRNRFLL